MLKSEHVRTYAEIAVPNPDGSTDPFNPCPGPQRGVPGVPDVPLKCADKVCVPKSGAVAKLWAQCGGKGYSGPTKCAAGAKCKKKNARYSQCVRKRKSKARGQAVWKQCGGKAYKGEAKCASGNRCVLINKYYSQCQPKA